MNLNLTSPISIEDDCQYWISNAAIEPSIVSNPNNKYKLNLTSDYLQNYNFRKINSQAGQKSDRHSPKQLL